MKKFISFRTVAVLSVGALMLLSSTGCPKPVEKKSTNAGYVETAPNAKPAMRGSKGNDPAGNPGAMKAD